MSDQQADLSSWGAGGDADLVEREARHVTEGDERADLVDLDERRFPPVEETVDLAVTQVDYTVEGYGDDEYPVLHVFGRTENREVVHVRVEEFQPYFYTPIEDLTHEPNEPLREGDFADERLAEERIVGLETNADLRRQGEEVEGADDEVVVYESIRGERLVKVFGQTPRDVGQLRDRFSHYEADILFPNRLLIDKDITSGVRVPARWTDETVAKVHHAEIRPVELSVDPRVNTFDIEVDDRQGFPEEGEETIICLTSHDSYDDEYVVWLYEAPDEAKGPDSLADYDPISEDLDARVERFETEEAMLEAFLDYIETTDPDILTGWNFDDFDAPYFIDRLERLESEEYDLDYNRLSRVNEVWRSDWQGPNIKGRVVFDLLYAYKRTQFTELDSYRLDAVGEVELGVGKERYAGDIGDLWENDPERLLEYNLRDVELCVELNRKQDIIPFWQEVASFVGCKLEDATTPGDAVDLYILHKVHGEFALPSKGAVESEDYEGGAVFDPISGVMENVTVLDLKCFSEDTNVLTPKGPRNIRELEVGDEIYTLNPETFECEVKPVAETHEYPNRFGELHHLSGNTHDLKVTENHRFLVSDDRGWDDQSPSDFEFLPYRDIPDYERFAFPQHRAVSGATPETFDLIDEAEGGNVVVYTDDDLRRFRNRMPEPVTDALTLAHGSSQALGLERRVGKYLIPLERYREHRETIDEHADDVFLKYDTQHRETPPSFDMVDWLEFIGWYVTEGSLDRNAGRVTLHQQDPDGRDSITALLDRMGLNYNTGDRGVNISNRYALEWLADNCGVGFADKRLPEWVFGLDSSLLEVCLDTMIRGDGSHTDSGLRKFWTKSEHLRDAVADLAVRCGHKPTVSEQSDGTWYVSVGKRGSFKKETNATVEPHDGNVYCVTAEDNHVVLAGRNGNYQWVGQSLYPMCMVTINASPETKVGADYDGDTYKAPNGTHFRKEPDGIIREMVDELLTEREEKKGARNDHAVGSDEYERFDRQQAAVKVIMNCFTPDTDVLTPDGVRNIRDLDVGDEVYSLDPETMRMEVKPVVETHAYPDYRGELVDIQTSKTDFRVTPNHRMLVRQDDTNGASWDDFRFVEAGELNDSSHYELPHGWDGPDGERLDRVDLTEHLDEYEVWVRPSVHGHTFTAELGWTPRRVPKADLGQTGYVFTPDEFEDHREYIESVCEMSFVHLESGRKWIPRTYDGDDFLQLLAWYITEGSVYTSEDKQFGEQFRGSATTIQIAQDAVPDGGAGDDHTAIGGLLDRMGFDAYTNEKGYQFTSRVLGEWLESLCGENSFEKRIPDLVFDASREQKERFLDTLIAGDGDRQVNSWRYTTSSERLRDDLLRLCAHLGLTASYNHDSGSWRVYCTEDGKNSFRMHRSGGRSTAEDGVYCVTVADNNTLLAGRNGKYQFVGNSLYGVLGWDRFRLYDKEMGAAVTATGREVIAHTENAANEVGHEVAYGDTDSVMLEIGHISADDIDGGVEVTEKMREAHPDMDESELEMIAAAIEKGHELEEAINGSYDEFALDTLDAAHHRFQIEFEKLYRRFFQAGKKKRYAGHIVWKEGKDVDDIDITGFEYKRSDIAPVTKEVQKEVLDMIVRGEDLEVITEYVHEVISDFLEGNLSLDEIGIPGGIGKRLDDYDTDTAHVRGAKYANLLLGTNFQRGSKPKRLYLKKVHPEFFRKVEAERGLDPAENALYGEFKRDPDVICFEYADEVPDAFEVDWDKMLDKTLKGPIARIIESLDVSWDEVKSGQEQTGLGSFM
ncbi:DNA polymerase domain-containing protein [Natronomonas sp. EA1]|uniref:DNA polymerase domain-containing protein n=1 Tax=Natronomonas sp. EA1 TaxID=3421655 RepID=UPI003EBA1314